MVLVLLPDIRALCSLGNDRDREIIVALCYMNNTQPARGPGEYEFYRFFCRWSVDGRAAPISVVAGSISGAILTIIFAVSAIISYTSSKSLFANQVVPLAIASCSAIATYAAWNRIASGAVINAIIGLTLIAWLCSHGDIAMAVVIFVPAVCGPLTGARGAYVLTKLAKQ